MMKTIVCFSINLIIYCSALSQNRYKPVPITTFISLFGKSISNVDSVFSTYTAELDDLNEKDGTVSWKKGFNGDHSKNNEQIFYHYRDSIPSFIYMFALGKLWSNDGSVDNTYEGYYQLELRNAFYFTRLEDTIEKVGEKSAIVKNYQDKSSGDIIKVYKISGADVTMIKILKN